MFIIYVYVYEIYTPKRIEIKSLFALEKPADWSYDFFH